MLYYYYTVLYNTQLLTMSAPAPTITVQEDQKKKALILSFIDRIHKVIIKNIVEKTPGELEEWIVAFLDIEMEMFDDLYKIINPAHQHCTSLSSMASIQKIVEMFQTYSMDYLQLFDGFLRQCDSDAFKDKAISARRSKDANTVRAFFAKVKSATVREDQKRAKKALILEYIDNIRQNVLAEIEAFAPGEHDPWDEAEYGVAWLDNEIGVFDDLYEIINPEHKRVDFEELEIVADAVDSLLDLSLEYHQLLNKFLKYGGTNSPSEGAFIARDSKDPNTVREFFAKFSQEESTQMQDVVPNQTVESA